MSPVLHACWMHEQRQQYSLAQMLCPSCAVTSWGAVKHMPSRLHQHRPLHPWFTHAYKQANTDTHKDNCISTIIMGMAQRIEKPMAVGIITVAAVLRNSPGVGMVPEETTA